MAQQERVYWSTSSEKFLGTDGNSLIKKGGEVIFELLEYDNEDRKQYCTHTIFNADEFEQAISDLQKTGSAVIYCSVPERGRDSIDPDLICMSLDPETRTRVNVFIYSHVHASYAIGIHTTCDLNDLIKQL